MGKAGTRSIKEIFDFYSAAGAQREARHRRPFTYTNVASSSEARKFQKFSSNFSERPAALQVRRAARRRAADDGGAAPWMSCPDTHILLSRLCEQCCVRALVRALTLLCG